MGVREKDPRIEKLKSEGKTVWSISRLNSFNQCMHGYWLNYIKRMNNKQNIYSHMGGIIHDAIEIFQNKGVEKGIRMDGVTDEDMVLIEAEDNTYLKNKYYEGLAEAELVGIKFPSEVIGNSWMASMEHWLDNYKVIPRKMATEKLVVFEPVKGIWVQGFIDVLMGNEDRSIDIMDWKTSSKFNKKDLVKSGRQLLLYELGVRDNFGHEVNDLSWYMFKYINLCTTQKNGKIKKTLLPRHKWVKEQRSVFTNALLKAGYDDFDVAIYIDEAVKSNDINCFPDEVKANYEIEDGYVYFDKTEDKFDELRDYLKSTVDKIESLDPENEEDWKPCEITMKDNFFCSNLCGVKADCKAYQKFIEENKDNFKKG